MLAVGFFSRESCWGGLQSMSLGTTTVFPTVWLKLVASSLFLAIMAQLCWFLDGVNSKWFTHAVPSKAEEAGSSPHSPFSREETLSSWGYPSALSNAGFGGYIYIGKMKLFFLPFLCSYSQGLCPTMLLKFFKCTPELSKTVFVCQ